MNSFLWVIVIVFSIDVLGKALLMAADLDFKRSRGGIVLDLILGSILVTWAIVLLRGLP